MKLYLASGNAHKVQEFQALADACGFKIEILSARAAGGMPPVEEDTGTFVGNSRKKARALKAKLPSGAWVLADDSGVCVDALGGAPGVESAYYAGPQADSAANLRKLIETTRHLPDGQRGAAFVCVLMLIDDKDGEHVFEGRCAGTLLREPAGEFGFGYDPIFVPDGKTVSYAQLSEDEKNEISHRGRAWAQLREFLKQAHPDLRR
jgi:XTP/dITP diphosphohydrolase